MDPDGTVLSKVANYRAGRINWVGGRLEVTAEELTFRANRMNAALGNTQQVTVPLGEVREVSAPLGCRHRDRDRGR